MKLTEDKRGQKNSNDLTVNVVGEIKLQKKKATKEMRTRNFTKITKRH